MIERLMFIKVAYTVPTLNQSNSVGFKGKYWVECTHTADREQPLWEIKNFTNFVRLAMKVLIFMVDKMF
ncbi:hypothetical protein [Cyclobacterium marinum]|uniref:hypothetical protein n=1 Tax=Cyclobacterium marinum TaxID=104 RepID=UPI0030D7576C|tara:strand:- start:40022 stop:40228 length:207 start_codon:yes stop_codon:yes gene_type:complete